MHIVSLPSCSQITGYCIWRLSKYQDIWWHLKDTVACGRCFVQPVVWIWYAAPSYVTKICKVYLYATMQSSTGSVVIGLSMSPRCLAYVASWIYNSPRENLQDSWRQCACNAHCFVTILFPNERNQHMQNNRHFGWDLCTNSTCSACAAYRAHLMVSTVSGVWRALGNSQRPHLQRETWEVLFYELCKLYFYLTMFLFPAFFEVFFCLFSTRHICLLALFACLCDPQWLQWMTGLKCFATCCITWYYIQYCHGALITGSMRKNQHCQILPAMFLVFNIVHMRLFCFLRFLLPSYLSWCYLLVQW